MPFPPRHKNWRRLANPFDVMVLAGGAVNLVIVAWLVGYWLVHG